MKLILWTTCRTSFSTRRDARDNPATPTTVAITSRRPIASLLPRDYPRRYYYLCDVSQRCHNHATSTTSHIPRDLYLDVSYIYGTEYTCSELHTLRRVQRTSRRTSLRRTTSHHVAHIYDFQNTRRGRTVPHKGATDHDGSSYAQHHQCTLQKFRNKSPQISSLCPHGYEISSTTYTMVKLVKRKIYLHWAWPVTIPCADPGLRSIMCTC